MAEYQGSYQNGNREADFQFQRLAQTIGTNIQKILQNLETNNFPIQERPRVEEREERLRGWAGTALMQRWLALLSSELPCAQFEAARAAWGDALRGPDRGLMAAALPFAGR